ncbi:MAG: MGMT family protein [bacterium]|nr:MGMT family protein [bacterium]
MTLFQKHIYEITKKIPHGRVSTYAVVARAIGRPKAVRAVGSALNKNPFAPHVPCHRVVRSDLTVGGFASGSHAKIKLLLKEGVIVRGGKIPSKYVLSYHSLL